MIEVDLDEIDDPVFETMTARINDGYFVIEGIVEIQGRRVMDDLRPPPRLPWRERRRVTRYPITLLVKGAEEFFVSDGAGTQQLILESIDEKSDEITLQGVIPCEISIKVSQASAVLVVDDQQPYGVVNIGTRGKRQSLQLWVG